MNDTIYNLIKENRKLFYNGQLRNKYKTDIDVLKRTNDEIDVYTFSEQENKKKSLTNRSIEILQDLFID